MKKVYLITYMLHYCVPEESYLSQQIECLEISKETDKVIFFAPNNLQRVKANKEDLEKIKVIFSEIRGLKLKLLTENKEEGLEQIRTYVKYWLEKHYSSFKNLSEQAERQGITIDSDIKMELLK